MSFALGFLTHVHGGEPARELYPAIVDLFVAAEELGFDSGRVAQHHFSTEEGRLPSPLVLLAAVAARTSRIRLGTAIVTLTLDDPVRVAEDAVVLDALADGRLELGLGSGNPHPAQFAAFGVDVDDRRARYDANVERLLFALRDGELAEGVRLQPSAGELASRIWESPIDPARVRGAVARGSGILLGIGPANGLQLELARAARDADPAARIALVHAAFPGESQEAVARKIWPSIKEQSLGYLVQAGWASEDSSAAEVLASMNVHHGSPDDIVSSIERAEALAIADELVLAVQARPTSVAEAIRSLEILANEVAPRLGWAASTIGARP